LYRYAAGRYDDVAPASAAAAAGGVRAGVASSTTSAAAATARDAPGVVGLYKLNPVDP
jgi:hypothetical protein